MLLKTVLTTGRFLGQSSGGMTQMCLSVTAVETFFTFLVHAG